MNEAARAFFRLNGSAIMVLPIFNYLIQPLKIGALKEYFTPMCFDNGLVNTYLGKNNRLYLLFKNENVNRTIEYLGHSLMMHLIAQVHYSKVRYQDKKHTCVVLTIPELYWPDLDRIRQQKYTELSTHYVDAVSLPFLEDIKAPVSELGKVFMYYNIPMCILNKCDSLYQYFNEYFNPGKANNIPSTINKEQWPVRTFNVEDEEFDFTKTVFDNASI